MGLLNLLLNFETQDYYLLRLHLQADRKNSHLLDELHWKAFSLERNSFLYI